MHTPHHTRPLTHRESLCAKWVIFLPLHGKPAPTKRICTDGCAAAVRTDWTNNITPLHVKTDRMKTALTRTFALMALTLAAALPAKLQAQALLGHIAEVSVYGGYVHRGGKLPALSSTDRGYADGLRNGFSLSAQANIFPTTLICGGAYYEGWFASSDHNGGSDHLSLNYIAPQICLNIPTMLPIKARISAGVGAAFYGNQSKLAEVPRKVSGISPAGHLGARVYYKFNSLLSAGVEASYLMTSFSHLKVAGERLSGKEIDGGRVQNLSFRAGIALRI